MMLFELDSVSGYWNNVAQIEMDDKMEENDGNKERDNVENEENDEFIDVEVELSGKARWYAVGGQAEACLLKVSDNI